MPKLLTKTFTSEEAASLLQVSTRTLRSWRAAGIVTPIRLGRTVRYTIAELERLLHTPR